MRLRWGLVVCTRVVRVRPPARRITLRCAAFGKRPLESSPVQLNGVVFARARAVAASDPLGAHPWGFTCEQAEDAARRAPERLPR
jgi:hypothetical protein